MRIQSQQQGFALLLSIIISSVVLAIGLTLLSVALKQLNLSATGRESEIAFQMANLGMECGRFHRTQYAEDYLSSSVSAGDIIINCVNSQVSPDLTTNMNIAGQGSRNRAIYEFDVQVGAELRCVNMEINILRATSDLVTRVGRIDTQCARGDACTVIISQGYNRSCAEKNTSLFSVQRELTAEF